VTHEGVDKWRAAYDAAGIVADPPPPALMERVASSGLLVASDMPRAIASADRLADGRTFLTSPLLREVGQPVPRAIPLRLPMVVWNYLIAVKWGIQVMRGTDGTSEERVRAREAALWLDALTRKHDSVAVVTHGGFRRMLAFTLRDSGWKFGPDRRGYYNWSAWTMTSDT
jgi:broad specificity phosphatase PhoE